MMNSDISESAYIAWLASLKMPADCLTKLLERCRTGESVYRMARERDDKLTETVPNAITEKMI